MSNDTIRIGIVGAGRNTVRSHIPGFRAMPNVEIVSVCNRSRESGERVAKEHGIPNVYDHWTELVDADDTDAICIGTWPYMHCPITLRTLERGKHVLCEARMAMNASEAHAMLDAARSHPELIAQLAPTRNSLEVDPIMRELLAEKFLGRLLVIDVQVSAHTFSDADSLMHWRHDRALTGFNMMNLGQWSETLTRWFGPASRVMATTRVHNPYRRDASGMQRIATVPDHVEVVCDMVCGAQARYQVSEVTGFATPAVWMYGSEGTLKFDVDQRVLYGARKGESELRLIDMPKEKRGGWRVEETFINAIRGVEPVTFATFEEGVAYMEFTEAVARSAQDGTVVSLPL
ncbi:MAG: Gfo/Idh/MocA family oxidoreductase [Dehalococcoidia bacterium]